MTESLNPGVMREEVAFLHDRVVGLERRLEEARTDGDPAEVRRLWPLYAGARERLAHARRMPDLYEAATALNYREGEGWQGLEGCREALDHLLREDGVTALEVVEAGPTRVTLVGSVWWLSEHSGPLVEATFTFEQDSHTLTEVVVRAGDERLSDDPYPQRPWDEWSPRQQAKWIASRPESDEQWDVVIRAPGVRRSPDTA